MMPKFLPMHKELVYISGVIEAGLGLCLVFLPSFQSEAAWLLIATLIAIFPANINVALVPEIRRKVRMSTTVVIVIIIMG